ncbi:hypothetical protein D3C71_1558210 [compost metagenome]
MGQLAQLFLHRGDDFRVQVPGVEHRDAAGEVDELAALDVGDGGVLRPVGEDRMDLADAARDGGAAALHQGVVGFAHGVLIRRSSGGVVQG